MTNQLLRYFTEKYTCECHGGARRKGHEETFYGNCEYLDKICGNPSNSCRDILVWTRAVDWQSDITINRVTLLVWLMRLTKAKSRDVQILIETRWILTHRDHFLYIPAIFFIINQLLAIVAKRWQCWCMFCSSRYVMKWPHLQLPHTAFRAQISVLCAVFLEANLRSLLTLGHRHMFLVHGAHDFQMIPNASSVAIKS